MVSANITLLTVPPRSRGWRGTDRPREFCPAGSLGTGELCHCCSGADRCGSCTSLRLTSSQEGFTVPKAARGTWSPGSSRDYFPSAVHTGEGPSTVKEFQPKEACRTELICIHTISTSRISAIWGASQSSCCQTHGNPQQTATVLTACSCRYADRKR